MQQKLRKAFKQKLLYKKIKMEKAGKEKFKVTPWEVSGKVDYNRLIKEFGTERISENMLKVRWKKEEEKDREEKNYSLC